MGRKIQAAAIGSLLVLALAGCSGDDDPDSNGTSSTSEVVAPSSTGSPSTSAPDDSALPTTGESVPSTSPPTSPPSSPPSSPPTTEAGPTTTEDPPPTSATDGETADAVAAWQSALSVIGGDGGSLSDFVAAGATDTFGAIDEFVTAPLTFMTNPTAGTDGTLAIEECLLGTGSETGSFLLRGEVGAGADGTYRVLSLDIGDAFTGCIPADVNEQVLAAYEAYWDAWVDFTSPPDPDSPLLDQFTAGSYRSFLDGLLTRLRNDGQEIRGRPGTRPEVTRYFAPDRVMIEDCYLVPEELGIYDVSSGVLADPSTAPEPGQRNYQETEMNLVDGRWKAATQAGRSDVPCDVPLPNAVVVLEVTP